MHCHQPTVQRSFQTSAAMTASRPSLHEANSGITAYHVAFQLTIVICTQLLSFSSDNLPLHTSALNSPTWLFTQLIGSHPTTGLPLVLMISNQNTGLSPDFWAFYSTSRAMPRTLTQTLIQQSCDSCGTLCRQRSRFSNHVYRQRAESNAF